MSVEITSSSPPNIQELKKEAALHREHDRLAEAEACLRQIVDAQRQDRRTRPIRNAGPLDQLGHVLRDQGKLDEAEKLYAEAKALRCKTFGDKHLEVAYSYDNEASVLRARQDLVGAEEAVSKALEIRRPALASDHPLLADSLMHLAQIELDQGKIVEAEQRIVGVVEVRRKTVGPAHRGYRESVSALLSLFCREQRLPAAEMLRDQVLAHVEQALEPDSLGAARLFVMLGNAFRQLGSSEADDLLARALPIYERRLGEDHSDTLDLWRTRLAVRLEEGRLEEAEPLLDQLWTRESRALGAEHPVAVQSLRRLAALKGTLGQAEEALEILERVLESSRDSETGDSFPCPMSVLLEMADLEARLDRIDRVEDRLVELLAVQEERLPLDHPQTLETLRRLGALGRDTGRFELAERRFQDLVGRLEGDTRHVDLATLRNIWQRAATARQSDGDLDGFADALLKLADSLETEEPKAPKEGLSYRQQILYAYLEAGRLADAEPVLEALHGRAGDLLGRDHPQIAKLSSQLTDLNGSLGRSAVAVEWQKETVCCLRRIGDEEALFPALIKLADLQEQAEDPTGALETLEGLVGELEAGPEVDRAAAQECLLRSSRVAEKAGRTDESELYLRRAVDIDPQIEHGPTLDSLMRLIELHYERRSRAEAETLMQEGLSRLAGDSRRQALLWDRMGLLSHERGVAFRAELCYRKGLALRQEASAPEQATSLRLLADLYADEGRFTEAEDLYRQCRELLDSATGESSEDPYTTDLEIEISRGLADLYADLGRPEAEPAYRRWLEACEKRYGESSLEASRACLGLGKALIQCRKPEEAEPFLARAYRGLQAILSDSHLDTATVALPWASALRGLGRLEEAEALLEKALALRIERLGEGHSCVPTTLNELGLVKMEQGALDQADELFSRALGAGDDTLDGFRVGCIRRNLGDLRRRQGRLPEAVAELRVLMADQERIFGPEHPEVGLTLRSLGSILREQGDQKEAEEALERSVEILETDGSELAAAMDDLGWAYFDGERYREAERAFRRSLEARMSAYGESHAEVGRSHLGISASLERLGESADALDHLDQCRQSWRNEMSGIDPATLKGYRLLSSSLGVGEPS